MIFWLRKYLIRFHISSCWREWNYSFWTHNPREIKDGWVISTRSLLRAVLNWEAQETQDIHGHQPSPSYTRGFGIGSFISPRNLEISPIVSCMAWPVKANLSTCPSNRTTWLYLLKQSSLQGILQSACWVLISSSLMSSFARLGWVSNFVNGTLALRSVAMPWFHFCESLWVISGL